MSLSPREALRAEYLAQRDDRVRPSTRQADDYLFKYFEPLTKKKMADITAEQIEDIIESIEAPTTRRIRPKASAGCISAFVDTCADGEVAPKAVLQGDPMLTAGGAVCAPRFPPGRGCDGRSKLSEMRHDLFGKHLHVVDLAVEVAGFRA